MYTSTFQCFVLSYKQKVRERAKREATPTTRLHTHHYSSHNSPSLIAASGCIMRMYACQLMLMVMGLSL